MYVEIVEILGDVEIVENKIGKAILFSIMDNEYNFNCILYIGQMLPFVTLHDNDKKYNDNDILNLILNKYKLEELKKL
jgi:hypothetical protein